MKPIYKMTLDELQELDGTANEANCGKEMAMYWLVNAITSLHVGRSPAQEIAYALKQINLSVEEIAEFLD